MGLVEGFFVSLFLEEYVMKKTIVVLLAAFGLAWFSATAMADDAVATAPAEQAAAAPVEATAEVVVTPGRSNHRNHCDFQGTNSRSGKESHLHEMPAQRQVPV